MTKLAEQPDWVNRVYCEDALAGLARIPDGSVDLILTDPPYNLGKDYGNASDQQSVADYLRWTEQWIDAALPKLKANGSLYIFLTWRYSPEIFVMLKQRMAMMNEIIWDRRVPSMGGSVRSFSSVHDTIGFFVKRKDYYFDLDAVRMPTTRPPESPFALDLHRRKWLEVGYNPKTCGACRACTRNTRKRADHPTQKPLESASAWSRRRARPAAWCSTCSWAAAPRRWRRSAAGAISSALN